MNIIEANEVALKGKAIMNLERNEWLIYSSGSYRWRTNRQPAVFSPKDISSTKWISEDDLITISKLQIDEAFKAVYIDPQDATKICGYEKMMGMILGAAKTNSLREETK